MTKATVTASSTAPNGTQSLKIKETAKAGSLTGAQINASSSTTTLAQLGYTGGDAQINVNTGGTTKTITLSATSTMSDVEKQLKETGLNASYDSNYKRFYISSKDTGVENDFTLTGANAAGASALYKLGIAVGASADGTRPNPYGEYAGLSGKNNGNTQQNIEDAQKRICHSSRQCCKVQCTEQQPAQCHNIWQCLCGCSGLLCSTQQCRQDKA